MQLKAIANCPDICKLQTLALLLLCRRPTCTRSRKSPLPTAAPSWTVRIVRSAAGYSRRASTRSQHTSSSSSSCLPSGSLRHSWRLDRASTRQRREWYHSCFERSLSSESTGSRETSSKMASRCQSSRWRSYRPSVGCNMWHTLCWSLRVPHSNKCHRKAGRCQPAHQ